MAIPKLNNQITAPELRVVDEKGENLGVMAREKALALAKEQGTDLIEIVPQANPPVARIMSFDKFRYLKEKEAKKERLAAGRHTEMKHVQISPRAAANDLMVRVRQLEKFLTEGHPVEIRVRMRGREKANKDWAFQKLNDFLKLIPIEFKIVNAPKYGGFGITAQIIKK